MAIKSEVPLPTIELPHGWKLEENRRNIVFSDKSKLFVNTYGRSDETVAAVARQFCSVYVYGQYSSYQREHDSIENVLQAAGYAKDIITARGQLAMLLDSPATAERIAEICPLWYPLWAEQFIREEVIEEARCTESDDLWGGGRRSYVKIDLDKIHEKLVERIEEEYPALFDEEVEEPK